MSRHTYYDNTTARSIIEADTPTNDDLNSVIFSLWGTKYESCSIL